MASTTTSLRDRHTAETRRRILDVAEALFIAKGFDATTIDEIAEGANVSARTFFRYFPTKESLVFHDVEEQLVQVLQWISERPADEPPATTMIAVLCRVISDVENTPERRALLLQLLRDRPAILAYQRATIAEHMDAGVSAALAARAGRPDDDPGIQAMVAALSACFDLALRRWTDRGATEPFEGAFLDTVAACGADFPRGPISLT